MNKFIFSLMVLFLLGYGNNAFAARWCSVVVDDISLTSNRIIVNTYNSSTNYLNDQLLLSYQDDQIGMILEKLAQSKILGTPVKIYIIEEFNGDDARSCSDGVVDYIGSVHNI